MLSINKNFSSRTSALILGTVFGASALVGGITYAQNTLEIPSELSNAVIAIKEIILSPTGTESSLEEGATIHIDGSNGDIHSKGNLDVLGEIKGKSDLYVGGASQLNEDLTLKKLGVFCDEILTEGTFAMEDMEDICVLFLDETGQVTTDGFLQTINNYSGDVNEILGGLWKPTQEGDEEDIYFADPSGVTDPDKILVRVGIKKSGENNSNLRFVTAGYTETRDGFRIAKSYGSQDNTELLSNNDTTLGVTRITQKDAGKSLHITQAHGGNLTSNPTSIVFENGGGTQDVSVGINTTNPNEALDVDGNILARENIMARENIAATGSVDAGTKKLGHNGNPTYLPLKRDGLLDSNLVGQITVGNNRNGGPYHNLPTNIETCRPVLGGGQDCTTDFSPLLAVNGAGWFNGSIQAEFDANIGGDIRVKRNAEIDGDANIDKNLDVGEDAVIAGSATATTYLYNSDRRYKSAITALDNPLDKILALNGYSYYNKLSDSKDIGIIAQEVEKVFPELVHTDDKGYKSVKYGNLVAPLIESVKTLNSKLERQADQINDLKARLDALEAK